jgi:hypothetical protein
MWIAVQLRFKPPGYTKKLGFGGGVGVLVDESASSKPYMAIRTNLLRRGCHA